jgi:hypothetical protein
MTKDDYVSNNRTIKEEVHPPMERFLLKQGFDFPAQFRVFKQIRAVGKLIEAAVQGGLLKLFVFYVLARYGRSGRRQARDWTLCATMQEKSMGFVLLFNRKIIGRRG